MNTRKLSQSFSISEQITPDDISELYEKGFRSIINFRPDNEQEEQPASMQLEAIAKNYAMEYHHIPVSMGKFSETAQMYFSKVVSECATPALGFCKTGKRAALVWTAHNYHLLGQDYVRSAVSTAGVSLDEFWETIEKFNS